MPEGDGIAFLDEEEDEVREEDEEEGHLTRPGGLVDTDLIPDDIEDFDYETILAAVPDELESETIRRDVEQRERQLRIVNQIQTQADVDLGGLREELSDLGDLDFDAASQTQLLQNLASSNLTIADTLQVMADTQVNILSTMNSVLEQVEPFRRITVSGTNDIDSADTAVEVVPGSEATDIPTRTLFIKASDGNQADIAFGDDEVDPDSGFILDPGEGIMLNIDLRDVTIWMASEDDTAEVELLGLV